MELSNLVIDEFNYNLEISIDQIIEKLFDSQSYRYIPSFEDFIISENYDYGLDVSQILDKLDLSYESNMIYKEYTDEELNNLGLSEQEYIDDLMGS